MLGLTEDQVRDSANFYVSYANTVERELITLAGGVPGVDRIDDAVQHNVPLGDAERVLLADLTSALRQAAQWAVLLSPARAARLLRRAARLLSDHSPGLALFLASTSASAAPSLGPAASTATPPPTPDWTQPYFDEGISVLRGASVSGPAWRSFAAALRYPQQQAYLLVAATATTEIVTTYRRELEEIVQRSPQRAGSTPVGALGTPIRVFWDISRQLLRGGDPGPVVDSLARMSRGYAEELDAARRDDDLWRAKAGPAVVVDLDILGLQILAPGRFAPGDFQDAVRRNPNFDALDSPIAVPLRLADRIDFPETDRARGPDRRNPDTPDESPRRTRTAGQDAPADGDGERGPGDAQDER